MDTVVSQFRQIRNHTGYFFSKIFKVPFNLIGFPSIRCPNHNNLRVCTDILPSDDMNTQTTEGWSVM